jgi:hypothetical protein
MTSEQISIWCKEQELTKGYLEIPESVFSALSADTAQEVSAHFNNNCLIKLPAREIAFFEWLKSNDKQVWDDLWGQPDEEPYLVSIIFLKNLIDKITGFPICDLTSYDNYYFTDEHIIDKEAKLFAESSTERFLAKESLTTAQALIMQISIQPTDIWHFAYYFNIPLNQAKEAVHALAFDKMLIHITDSTHLSSFIKL